jgi:hypothetical protein
MIYVVTVEDTVTYRRQIEITVDADDEAEAEALALDRADTAFGEENATYVEDQIDNTPYEVIAVHTD